MLNFKIKIVSLLSFILFATFIYIAFGKYTLDKHHKDIHVNMETTEKYIKQSVNRLLKEKKRFYEVKAKVIFSNKNILKALEEKNREDFYKYIKSYFNNVKANDKNFWELHIILPDNLSFIRVHKPNTPDKKIIKGKKPLIDKVNKTKKIATGFEAGKFGYFLRVVTPIFSKQNKYLGLAEFSVNVDELTQYIKNELHYESQFLIEDIHNKKFFNDLPKTQDGLVIFKSTSKRLLLHDLSHGTEHHKEAEELHEDMVEYDNFVYKIVNIELSGKSKLVVAFDVSAIVKQTKKYQNNVLNLVYLVLFISAVVWFFTTKFYIEHEEKQEDDKDKLNKNVSDLKDTINSYVAMTKADKDGNIIYVSDEFSRISGYSKDELLGANHNIMRNPNTPKEFYDDLWCTISSGKIFNSKITNISKDGKEFYFEAMIYPVFDENKNIIEYVALRKDRTSLEKLNKTNKHLQAALRHTEELNDELEETNKILDIKISEGVEKNLSQERKLFEQSKMVSMGEMIGNIAHQWRQPLGAISTASSGLRLEKDFGTLTDEKIDYFTDGIIRNAQYLSETIDTFRDFIREKKEIKEVILQDRVNLVLSIIGTTLKNNHIEIKNNIDYSKPVKITMVIGELSQVLINIMNNSKDILREKNIENGWIELNLIRKENSVIITIEDNGGGIPEDIIHKIFDAYFTTKHQSQGTGLGLHMSYRIVTESLHGSLSVENTDNGAKFFIELPLDRRSDILRRQQNLEVDYENREVIRRKEDNL